MTETLSNLLKSLDNHVKDYKLICYSNFKIELTNSNLEVRDYYDTQKYPSNGDKWFNLNFNRILIYRDLYQEFDKNFIWTDLDNLITHDVSYINDMDNAFLEIGGAACHPNIIFTNKADITVPRNRYIQGNFWKLNIKLYDELMATLNDYIIPNKLKLRYDVQDLFNYYNYANKNLNVLGFNVKKETANGLSVWGNGHPSVQNLKLFHKNKEGKLYSEFQPDKEIHILSFTFFTLKSMISDPKLKYILDS